MFRIFDKEKNRYLEGTYKFFYEANHDAVALNYDTGNWGNGKERFFVEKV